MNHSKKVIKGLDNASNMLYSSIMAGNHGFVWLAREFF